MDPITITLTNLKNNYGNKYIINRNYDQVDLNTVDYSHSF